MHKYAEKEGDYLPEERQRMILERLTREGRVVALELAQQFRTSEDTIRRDLRELTAAGLCRRVYGGALPVSPASTSLAERQSIFSLRKQLLGEKLASLLPAGTVVFADAGSTNLAAMRALPEGHELTLITHSPAIAAEVATHDGITLILIGGQVDRRTGGALGARALRDIVDLRPDIYLLGACALDIEAGIAAFGFDEAEFKRTLVAQSCHIITGVTSDKLATRAPFGIAPVHVLGDLVLEADAPVEQITALQRAGIRIHQTGTLPGEKS